MLYNTVDESVKVSAGIKIRDDGLFFFCLLGNIWAHFYFFFSWHVCIWNLNELRRFPKVLIDSVKLRRQRSNGKLPARGRHCVFKMDRFCVSGPLFPPTGHAAAVQNLSQQFFLEIQSLPSWFGGLCFPNCSIDVLRVTEEPMPGSLGTSVASKRSRDASGSKKIVVPLFFSLSLFLITPKRKVLISKRLWFKLRLSQNVDLIDVRIVFWHLICIWDC